MLHIDSKEYVSQLLKQVGEKVEDKTIETVLRKIIFQVGRQLDWVEIEEIIENIQPEMQGKFK